MNRKKILIFADFNNPLFYDRVAMLESPEHTLILIQNADGKPLTPQALLQLSHHRIIMSPAIAQRPLRYAVSMLLTLFRILIHQPDLIVVHWASRLYQNLILGLFGPKTIVHTMGGDIDSDQDAVGNKCYFTRHLLAKARFITVKSRYMRQMLIRNFPSIDPQKIHLLSWGVDPGFSTDTPLESETAHFFEEGPVFFCMRAMRPFYRKREILDAFRHYKQNMSGKGKLLVSTYGADPNYLETYQKALATYGLKEEVMLVNIPHAKMSAYLHAAAATVTYSKSDGLPQSVLESLAAQTWVIANDLPHFDEILEKRTNAFIFQNDKELIDAFASIGNRRAAFQNPEKATACLERKRQQKTYLTLCQSI